MSRRLCRVCLRPCSTTRRGRVWWHAARSVYGGLIRCTDEVPLSCPGAGLPPLGVALLDRPEPTLLRGQVRDLSPLIREHDGAAGTVYLVCLDQPFGHARHYLGWASPGRLAQRQMHHRCGSGANLLRHVAAAGIGWELSRTWPGDRYLERRLKNRGGKARLCPRCRPELIPRLLLGNPRAPDLDPAGSVCA